jgi:hypothetical protein
MKSIGSIFLVCGLALGVCGTAGAQTPAPPALRYACDGLESGGPGLCNAYCNAKRCHEREDPECVSLRQELLEKTGSPLFPCDERGGEPEANPGAKVDPGGDGSVAKPE